MIQIINSNPYFIACIMLLMNIGGRYLPLEFPKIFEKMFSYSLARKGIFFAIFFMATRDIRIALLLTILITIFFNYLLKEDSLYTILPESWIKDLKKDSNILPNSPIVLTQDKLFEKNNLKKNEKSDCNLIKQMGDFSIYSFH